MVTLRRAGPHDHAFVATASALLGTDDPALTPEKWQRELEPHTTIAEAAGTRVGYAFAQAMDDVGYLKHIVTMPQARRQGVGRALMRAAASSLRDAGCTEWMLNVKVENGAAKALYEALGLAFSYASCVLRLEWSRALALPAASLNAFEPKEGDDAALEEAFKLPDGLLRERRKLGRVLLAVSDPAPAGLAVFDPAFPGAFPFQARSLSVAGTLLRAMHETRRREDPLVNLVVERDARLIDALIEAGAEPRIRLEHWRGPLNEPW
jgi:GNAT superfamily N-acetyltransferase